jgi:hypothetical protein
MTPGKENQTLQIAGGEANIFFPYELFYLVGRGTSRPTGRAQERIQMCGVLRGPPLSVPVKPRGALRACVHGKIALCECDECPLVSGTPSGRRFLAWIQYEIESGRRQQVGESEPGPHAGNPNKLALTCGGGGG